MDQSSDSMKDQVTDLMRVINAADKEPCKIVEGLYLGSIGAANNTEALRQLNITHILTVVSLRPVHASDFVHKVIPVVDIESTNIAQYFGECIDFIDEARGQGSGVLVHCFAGRSRSVTIVVAYLMKKNGMCLSEALDHVRSKRPQASPNAGFILQLQEFERSLQEMESDYDFNAIYRDVKKYKVAGPKAGDLKSAALEKKRKRVALAEAEAVVPPPSNTSREVPSPVHVEGNPTRDDVYGMLENSPERIRNIRGKFKAPTVTGQQAPEVTPIEFQLGLGWRESQEEKRRRRDERLSRLGTELIPREPGWLIHEDQDILNEEDAKDMAPELWEGNTTARTLETLEHFYPNLDVASSRLSVLGYQMSTMSGWISRMVRSTNRIRTEAEQRATKAIAVVAKLIQRVHHYEQLLQHSRSSPSLALPESGNIRDDLSQSEAEDFVMAEASFLSAVKEWRNSEDALRENIRKLEAEKEKSQVDFTNLKNHYAQDLKAKDEENQKLRDELTKAQECVPKFRQALKDSVAFALDKYTFGFCLARKQIVERNPNADLSGLNGDEEPDEDSSWYGVEFLQPPETVIVDDFADPQ